MQSTIPQNNQPIFSAQTFLRRLSQNDSRIPPVVPDGIYGEQTQNAVMEFQKTKNIVPTGILDNETWDELVKEFEILSEEVRLLNPFGINYLRYINIKPGENSKALYVIQAMIKVISLSIDNINSVEITGQNSDELVEIIKQLQRLSDMPETGIIDIPTYNMIVNLYEVYL